MLKLSFRLHRYGLVCKTCFVCFKKKDSMFFQEKNKQKKITKKNNNYIRYSYVDNQNRQGRYI